MPAKLVPDQSRGYLIPIGQSVRPDAARAIYRRLIALIGERPTVAVIAAAASDDPVPEELDNQLLASGAAQVRRATIASRGDAEQRALLALVESADLVLLCADQPLRLSTLLGGTVLARLLRKRNADGMAVGGIGAGAAILAEHMLVGGAHGPTPRMGSVTLAPGLGLSNRLNHRPGRGERRSARPPARRAGVEPVRARYRRRSGYRRTDRSGQCHGHRRSGQHHGY